MSEELKISGLNGELLMTQTKELKDVGLFHGKMGVCIYYYMLGRECQSKEYTECADSLLDEIYDQVSGNSPANLESGLAGIGWGIAYLAQHGFVEVDLDEALVEVDNVILKVLTSDAPLGLNPANGLTGYLCYLVKRLEGSKPSNESYSIELNKELLMLVTNKIEQCFCKTPPMISKDIRFDLFSDLPMMICSLGKACELGIYNDKIERVIDQIMPFLETNMPSLSTNRLHLACELKHLLTRIPDKRIERQVDILLYSTDFDQLGYEVGDNAMGIRNGLSGLKILLVRLLQVLPTESLYYTKTRHALGSLPEITEKLPEGNLPVLPGMLGLAEGLVGVKLMKMFRKPDWMRHPMQANTTTMPI